MTLAIVFGANGFIGSQVADAMDAFAAAEVIGAGLGTPQPGWERRWLDLDLLTESGRLEHELRAANPAFIVNCTGATSGTTDELIRLNVLTTASLVRTLAGSGVRARLIHLGSAAEYGPGPIGLPVTETTCPRPVSDYGIAKLAATQLVVASAAEGQDAAVLRVFNAIGPSMPPGSMPGSALRRLSEATATSASRIEMGPLGAVRDFIDVRDVASAVVAACRAPRLGATVFNVGSGTGHTARELVRALAERTGFGGEIGEEAAGSPRSQDVPWQVADVSSTERLLGWRAAHDLDSSAELMAAGLR
jgi:nucleoside-diphosphate-sugar epimerase